MFGAPDFFNGISSFYYRAGWRREFVWWPQRCCISNRVVWLTHAYKGTAVWTGPGKSAVEHSWHAEPEHIIWKLKEKHV